MNISTQIWAIFKNNTQAAFALSVKVTQKLIIQWISMTLKENLTDTVLIEYKKKDTILTQHWK